MQSTCHCHSMWLLPCYADSGCLIGCLFCCKVQELSMFHVLKVGGTRNTTVPTPPKKKNISKRGKLFAALCVCVWVGTSHLVAPLFNWRSHIVIFILLPFPLPMKLFLTYSLSLSPFLPLGDAFNYT